MTLFFPECITKILRPYNWYNRYMEPAPLIYLDHAAATPVADFVLDAMRPYMNELFYNPSSPYAPAINVRHDYEAAKAKIAAVIGAKPDELIMTAGATESINLMMNSASGHIVTSNIEHQAVLKAAEAREHTFVQADKKGTVRADAIKAALLPSTTLVSIALANNELGTIQPLKDIAVVVQQERDRRRMAGEKTPLYFHTDASQGAGLLDLHVSRLGVDAMTLNAGKVYGPKQVGLLWVASHVMLNPVLQGGGQERGLRSGTENVAGTIGFAVALTAADSQRKSEVARITALRDTLQKNLTTAFPSAIISGNQKKQLPNFLHISFTGLDAERLLFSLETKGVLVATGSACAANKGTRSHVLNAIGMDPATADGSLRITLGKLTDESAIMRASDSIIDVVTSELKRVGR